VTHCYTGNGNSLHVSGIPDPSPGAKKLVSFTESNAQPAFDDASQIITATLKECGDTKLFFASGERTMEIPVYIYYENIPVNWISSNTGVASSTLGRHSRLDDLGNAIYIADKEDLDVKVEMDGNYVKGYSYDDVIIKSIQFGSGNTNSSFDANNVNLVTKGIPLAIINSDPSARAGFYNRSNTNILGIKIRGNIEGGGNILKEVKYVGILTVNYEYSGGGTVKVQKAKNFLVYHEKWGNN
jgi:hypothetical protein